MTLNLNLDLTKAAGRGRAPAAIEYEVGRELELADLELLATSARGVVAPDLQRITERHHSLARLLAAGTPEAEAALITQYDISRVSILKQAPAFQELLAFYSKEVQEKFASNLDHMAGLSMDALMELRQRVEESPQDFSARELLAIVTEMNDRTAGAEADPSLPTQIDLNFVSPDESDPD